MVWWLRTPSGIYWTLTAGYAGFAVWTLLPDPSTGYARWDVQEQTTEIFTSDLLHWVLLLYLYPALVFFVLLLVPVVLRSKKRKFSRGLRLGARLHLPWQLLWTLIAAWKYGIERELGPDPGLGGIYLSTAVGFVAWASLLRARRFCLRAESRAQRDAGGLAGKPT